MGYGTRTGGTPGRGDYYNIQTFWPDDTEDSFYIAGQASLGDIMERASDKWPGICFDDITIEAEYIHTDCLGYDLFDPGDYTNFLLITRMSHA